MVDKVLIYGVGTPIGLSLIRELGEHGVEVYVIAKTSHSIGLFSRYVTKSYVYENKDEQFIPFISELCRSNEIPYLMTVSESDIQYLNQYRDNQLKEIKCLFAENDTMQLVLDKEQTYRYAHEVGIHTPETLAIDHYEDINAHIDQLIFPVVLKWASPELVAAKLKQYNLPLDKFRYCYSKDDLRQYLKQFNPLGLYPLIQSYCPGYGLGQMIFMHQDKALIQFQHQRINEWPPEGGASTYCKSLPATDNNELMKKSIELLKKMKWQGSAMVEYRYDPETGRAILMEINGRYWGSLPLAYHSRATFAWYSYRIAKGDTPKACCYRENVACFYGTPELKRLFRILFQAAKIQNRSLKFSRFKSIFLYLFRLLNFKTKYYLFQFSDPQPFFHDVLFTFKKVLKIFIPKTISD